MTQKNVRWLVPLVLVSLLLIFYKNTGRGTAIGEYDGQQDYFEVNWGNTTNATEARTLYPLEVIVSNHLQPGSMYVRCRIVPRNTSWLPSNLSREAGLDFLPTSGTCLSDANGQTARVTLATHESIIVPFTLITPTTPDISAVSCMTIERCWMTNATDYRSDHKAFLVNITPRTSVTGSPINASYLCTLDQDCDAYNLFGPQRCISGRCVDNADIAPITQSQDQISQAAPITRPFKQWLDQHKNASIAGIVVLLLAGLYLLRRKK